jgi:glycosyltransferase involved in cell wall biosynthesis
VRGVVRTLSAVPVVSVVVLTFNREALLRETIASILAQDFPDLELIVVDNMSVDGTQAYVRGIADPRVRYLRNANGGVLSVNRNLAIRHAAGEFIAFCDDDDLWLPQKLGRQVQAMRAAPGAGLCFTNGVAFRDSEVVIARLVAGKKHLARRSFWGLLMENTVPSCSALVRRSALEEVGLFDESPELVAVEDYELWLRIARCFALAFVDEPLVRVRLHANLSAKPSVTVVRNVAVIRSVSRKLGVNGGMRALAVAYQRLKYGWFRLQGR